MYKSILKNKSFLGYWGSTTLMRLASNMLQFALAIFVLDLTGSALIFSTVLSAIIFPRIIGTPIAGYLADYKDCLRILKLGALGLTALMLSFFLIHTLITPLNISLIYVLVICLELCETLISASEMKAVICIVDENQIAAASKLSSLDDGIVEILSPVIAGFAYGLFGIQAVLLATLVSELVAFLLTLMLRDRAKNMTENPGVMNKQSLFHEAMTSYKEAIVSLQEYNYVLGVILFAPLFNFFVSPLFSVTVPHFIRITTKSSIEIYTAYNLALGIASVVAPFIAMWLIRDKAEHKANLRGTIIYAFLMASIIRVVRRLKPSIIVLPSENDIHPDHIQTSLLVKKGVEMAASNFCADSYGAPHNCKYILSYRFPGKTSPVADCGTKIYMDVSEVYEEKMKLIKTYKSQIYRTEENSKTEINRGLLSLIESTDRINGSKIGACYAEELCLVKGCLGSENLFKILF